MTISIGSHGCLMAGDLYRICGIGLIILDYDEIGLDIRVWRILRLSENKYTPESERR
jgi:hypothetical protein